MSSRRPGATTAASGRAPAHRRARVWVGALLLTLAAACSSGAPEPRPGDLDATVAQFRPDEVARVVTAGVTNDGEQTIRVTAATIRWGGLSFPAARLDGAPVPPGQTAVFKTSYAAARCTRPPGGGPVLVATVDGRRTTLPLSQDDPTLFRRLHTSTCARARLDEVATVRLVLGTSLRRTADGPELPASLLLTRRPRSAEPVGLVDLDGSVLLRLRPARGAGALPTTLRTGERELRVPVAFGSTGRCDGHSLGQSQQTFLLSAFLRLPGEPVQREVLALTTSDRAALQSLVDRSCHVAR